VVALLQAQPNECESRVYKWNNEMRMTSCATPSPTLSRAYIQIWRGSQHPQHDRQHDATLRNVLPVLEILSTNCIQETLIVLSMRELCDFALQNRTLNAGLLLSLEVMRQLSSA
jgi:hypothetical protein